MTRSIFASVTADKARALWADPTFPGSGIVDAKRRLMNAAALEAVSDLLQEEKIDHRLEQVLTYLLNR